MAEKKTLASYAQALVTLVATGDGYAPTKSTSRYVRRWSASVGRGKGESKVSLKGVDYIVDVQVYAYPTEAEKVKIAEEKKEKAEKALLEELLAKYGDTEDQK